MTAHLARTLANAAVALTSAVVLWAFFMVNDAMHGWPA